MNATEAKEAVRKYGSQRAAERALGMASGSVSKAIKRGVETKVRTCVVAGGGREGFIDEAASRNDTDAVGGGIHLTPGTRILDRRPPATVRGKFWTLPKGKAFPIPALAKQWGFSPETVKRHARDEGCFAYVDTTGHDDFEECVMHPETAKSRMKGNQA